MILRVIIWVLLLVMAYRFMVRFIFPLLKITRMTRQQLTQMQQQMEDMQRKTSPKQQSRPAPKDDYIDYEELK